MSKSIFIYGFHSVNSQIESAPERILSIKIDEGRHDNRIDSLKNELNALGIKYNHCSKNHLHKLSGEIKNQGVVAEIVAPTLPNQNELIKFIGETDKPLLILILDSIQDPRNMGACLRSANAANVDCVIINKDGSAPINSLVHKTSAGSLAHTKVFQVTNLSRTIKSLQDKDIWVVGLDGNTKVPIYSIDFKASSAIVMGSEGVGLRKLTKQSCDQLAAIPMGGNVESLNVSVAAGVALFEVSRQRNYNI
jgi:23S rRNA (guanosine2251-2'-O)-methyltransferase